MPLYGPRWPLTKGYNDTYDMYDDPIDQVNFYLKNLILTFPGENLSDPEYGVGIRRYLFENNVDSVRGQIISNINTQISIYLPFLNVQDIFIEAEPDDIDNLSINIKIFYITPDSFINEMFELSIDNQQNIGFY